jgi:hypothetical protein
MYDMLIAAHRGGAVSEAQGANVLRLFFARDDTELDAAA